MINKLRFIVNELLMILQS